MAQLIVRNLDEELVARLKLARPNTAGRPKPSIAKFFARRSRLSLDDPSGSWLRESVR